MKVVFGVFSGEGKGGGVGRIAEEIGPAFAKKGHCACLISPGAVTKLRKTGKNYFCLTIEGNSDGEIIVPRLNGENIQKIFTFLDKFKPDLVHLQDIGPLCFLLQIWALKNKKPCVYTAHVLPSKVVDFGVSEIYGILKKVFNKGLVDRYQKLFLNNCDGVIALNKEAAKDLRRFGYKGKMFLISNGRNLSWYKRCLPADINKKRKNLIFVGYLSERKNQKYLLKVMKFLPDFTLNLVGNALSPKYLENLQKIIQKEHLNNVNFLGNIAHENLLPLLEKSHLFISASKMEVQSLVVIEALAAGRPVVGLANETISEFIDDSVGACLSRKTSPEEFAQKVLEICNLNEKDYRTLCRNAQEKVMDLDWSKIVDQLTKSYNEIISEKKKNLFSKRRKRNLSFPDFQELASMFEFNIPSELKEIIPKISRNEIYLMLIILTSFIGGSALKAANLFKRIKEGPFSLPEE